MRRFPFDIEKVKDMCRKNDIAMIGIFGSMIRGESTQKSDVDMLVRFFKPKSLLSVVALEREIGILIGRKIDLLTEEAISPYLRERILGELQVIYEAG
jgi:hypothetical protein